MGDNESSNSIQAEDEGKKRKIKLCKQNFIQQSLLCWNGGEHLVDAAKHSLATKSR